MSGNTYNYDNVYKAGYAAGLLEYEEKLARLKAVNEELIKALEAVQRVMRKGIVGEEARKAWAMVHTALAKAKEMK